MGMAASQARLLSLTARIHDVEFQAQQIQSRKLELALLEDEAYQKYTDALDATTLTFTNDTGALVPANFSNLCGEASITNGLSKHFVFRTSDDELIVPQDIYDGYMRYGKNHGNDPYEFAMFMMGIDNDALYGTDGKQNRLQDAENEFISSRADEGLSKTLQELQTQMRTKASEIYQKCGFGSYIEIMGEGSDLNFNSSDMAGISPKEGSEYYNKKDDLDNAIDEYNTLTDKYRYNMYQKGGAEIIYNLASGEGELDKDKFNYYLRWGMLLQNEYVSQSEYGLVGCACETDYGDDFGKNGELLNQMLQSGKILVDTVSIDKSTGRVKDDTTSVAADSNLQYTNTSTIDKKALAQAEAEYEHTMKQLDRKDKKFDTDLNRLETERTALTTEYDSVKKVIQENIERTFGIFS